MFRRYSFFGVLIVAAALVGCGGGPANSPDATAADGDPGDAAVDGFRLAIEISNDIPASIFVQLNQQDGQPAWVTVRQETERMYLQERCEIDECDDPDGVCGAAVPMVRDITGGTFTGSIAFVWTGETSQIEIFPAECERRVPAPEGEYTATFCIGFQAEIRDQGDPTEGVSGSVIDPQCTDVPFRLPDDREAVYRLVGG